MADASDFNDVARGCDRLVAKLVHREYQKYTHDSVQRGQSLDHKQAQSRRSFFESRRRHPRFDCDWSSDVCSSDLIPAFLCRQTDLLLAAGRGGRPVNVKKGQWMSPEGMAGAVEKVRAGGVPEVAVTERGSFFGYGDLVVDMRSFARLRAACGTPVVYDATHSVQQPGQGPDGSSGGLRAVIPPPLDPAAAA